MRLKARCSQCNRWATLFGFSLICSCGAHCSVKIPVQGVLSAVPLNPFEEAHITRTQAQMAFKSTLAKVRRKSDAWSRLKALTGGCIQFSKMNREQCQHVMAGIANGSFRGV